jgi:hypothetical protein
MWYIYTMEYYSALKKNEIMLFADKWMEVENIMLSESQAQKGKGQIYIIVGLSKGLWEG